MVSFPNIQRPLIIVASFLFFLLLPAPALHAQVAGFLAPDTVCTGEQVSVTNTTTGGSTYYWNFCSGNANQNPSGTNIGNPGNLLDIPTYLTLVQSGTNYWSFVSCQGVGVVRYFHGNSFKNNPQSWTNLGTFGGTITFSQEGIQVKEDNGQWYGFVCSDTKLVRLNFSNSPGNTPTATSLNFSGLNMLHGLVIIKEGTTWLGFATCSTGNKMVRFNFGTSLANTPVMTDFGNFAGFNTPAALCIVQENSLWYGLVMAGGNTISRITFGTSLLNTPTGTNLGNPGGLNSAGGLTLLRDCESTIGYYVNYLSPGQLGKLTFPTGITGTVSGQVLGNIGNLAQPHSFSELFRQNDTLFAYITNRQNGTLTRLTFPPCSNASIPSSTLFNPPSFSYNTAGTYNVRLIVNEGMPTQTSICKSIVVMAAPCTTTAAFTAPDTVCVGEAISLTNQSTAGGTYYWSFCSGNALANPLGQNIGNPGNMLDVPAYITLVKDGTTCYSFLPSRGNMSLIRYNHGSSFSNNPVSWTNLGNFGLLSVDILGIKICQDNGQWIGFIADDDKLVRLNFGNSLGNTPVASALGPYSLLSTAHCIDIFKEGNTWIGFLTCSTGNKFIRLNFGTSLLNSPVLTDFGTPGAMNQPFSFRIINENGIWYGLVANSGNNTMTRLIFGPSLLNSPTGTNLGIVCPLITPGGITLIRDCEGTTGFQLNYSTSSTNLIWRLSFPAGITGAISGTSLGNIGSLNRPAHFSELFRVGDTLFLYATNRQNNTLTRLRFLPCSNASVPSSTLYNPPAFTYNQPGTYNIQLIVNEGLPTQASVCKSIVVMAAPCTTTAAFTAPDTVCVGEPISLTNQSTTGETYYWSFCSGNALANPLGQNIGNPGNLLNIPGYITLVKGGGTCYSFITAQGTESVIRYNHGASFSNNPVSWTNLGGFGLLADTVLGIKICNDNGQWIGIVNNNNRLVRLNFGTSLANTPTATLLGSFAILNTAHCLDIFREGTTWIGYITCSWGNKLVRLNFGTSLLNAPVLTDLGTPGSLNMPGPFRFVNENGLWYALVVNLGNNTMTRLTFGNSLLNTPTGVNLGNPCPGITSGGITLIRDCEGTTGFQMNYSSSSPNLIWRLSFPNGITGSVTGTSLGNIGGLSRPSQFSELFRVGDTLFVYNTNRDNFTLTRHRFLPCGNASVSSSTLYNPPSFSYNQPGTYNIQLIVNEGLPNQASVCKSIVVLAAPCTTTASFTAPDTVCVGEPVSITNQSTAGASYYWNFCSGNAASTPVGFNMGTLGGNLNYPVYSSLVKEGSDCFTFITNQGVPTHITRIYHGNSFRNAPVSTVSILQTGILHQYVEALQVINDNGTWYGLVCNNTTVLRLNFGASLWNVNPTVTDLGPFTGLLVAHGIRIVKEGNTWLAFFNSSSVHKLYRLDFGTSLANTPVFTDFGNIAVFAHPVQIAAIKENGLCYLFMNNYNNNTLSRISFGNSYINAPTGQNLGNCGGLDKPHGISLLNDCETSTGYYTTYRTSPLGAIGRLNFSGGVGGTVTSQSLGNLGNLDNPCSFSELFRENDSLFSFVLNQYNSTMTRFSFPPCTNASVPSSTLYNPPTYTYSQPGTYNVRLIVNEGLFTQSSLCKSIVVMAAPVVSLGNDRSICPGTTTTLNAGAGFASYLWSTGAISQMITVGNAGSYWVKVTKYGCIDYDTVSVSLYPITPVNLGPDATVCEGQTTTFNAGYCIGCAYVWSNLSTGQPNIGTGATYTTGIPGIYSVKVTSPDGCISRDTVELSTNPSPILNPLPVSQPLCSGTPLTINLSANYPICNFTWTITVSSPAVTGCYPGTGNTISQTPANSSVINQTVTYQITPFIGSCVGSAVNYTIIVKPVPVLTVSPPSQSVCHGSNVTISLSSNITGTAISWDAYASSPLVTGFSSSSGSSISQTLYNAATTIETVTYMISPLAYGCFGDTVIYDVPVIPAPLFTIDPPAQTICSGNSTTITFIPASTLTTFSWMASLSSGNITGFSNGFNDTIRQVLTNHEFTAGSVIYSVTAEISGCFSPAVACTVTVNPSPSITNAGLVAEMCSGDTAEFNIQANVSGTQFSWTAEGNSPNLTGFGPGTGALIAQQLFNNGFSNPSVTYTVTPTALGCSGGTGTFTAIVHPIPDVGFTPSSLTICTGSAIQIQLTSQVQSAAFSWEATGSSGFVSNFSDGTGTSIQQAPLNSGPDPETVTYFVTPASNGCSGTAVPFIATINPSPVVNISAHPGSICSGDDFQIIFSSPTAGTSFYWTVSASSPAITGYSDGNGNTFTHVLGNPGSMAENVTYFITSQANGCAGINAQLSVNVKPRPGLSFSPETQSVCYGQPAQISLSASLGGAICSWTASGSSASVTGFSNGSGTMIYQNLFNTGTTAQTVDYFLKSTLNGCISDTFQSVVLTYPLPVVLFSPTTQSVCSGNSTGIALESQVSGTAFQWTATGSPNVNGYSGGSNDTILQILLNSSNTGGWASYTITPSVSNCAGSSSSVTVDVLPVPNVTFRICNDSVTTTAAKPFHLRGGLPYGGAYSGTGVDGNSGIFNPASSGSGLRSVQYTYTNNYGCPKSSALTIRVLPDQIFNCTHLFTDIRDGCQYATYKLPDGKCWLASNLNYGKTVLSKHPQTDNCLPEKYCLFDNSEGCSSQGGFYQWEELMDYVPVAGSKGLCPPTWHVPTTDEWMEMLGFNMGQSQASGPLRDKYLQNGFHALPAGVNYLDWLWAFAENPLQGTFFWTSTASGPSSSFARGLNRSNASISLYSGSRGNAFSVRCVKD
jgi:uncharacterized protein (TIGR02145 family)